MYCSLKESVSNVFNCVRLRANQIKMYKNIPQVAYSDINVIVVYDDYGKCIYKQL